MNIGDIVTRKSYGHDIPFYIQELSGETAILSGLRHRLLADAPVQDLCAYHVSSQIPLSTTVLPHTKDCFACTNSKRVLSDFLDWFQNRTDRSDPFSYEQNCHVKILHIDGNKRYLKECLAQYRSLCVPVVGFSIEENLQPQNIYRLLSEYQPNILVITGHDTIKKPASSLSDLGCYLNSRYFVESVKIARTYNKNSNELVIIAGGCKSHYEALIDAGANFASSPKRVLINVTEPVSIACRIATTSVNRILTMEKIAEDLPSGTNGFGGIDTRGQCREIAPAF